MKVKEKPVRERVPRKLPEARTPEQREQQMINYAIDLAEEQLRNGTASSQVITHYLKLGSMRERLERDRIQTEIDYNRSKIKHIDDLGERDRIASEAIEAMKMYRMPLEDDGR